VDAELRIQCVAQTYRKPGSPGNNVTTRRGERNSIRFRGNGIAAYEKTDKRRVHRKERITSKGVEKKRRNQRKRDFRGTLPIRVSGSGGRRVEGDNHKTSDGQAAPRSGEKRKDQPNSLLGAAKRVMTRSVAVGGERVPRCVLRIGMWNRGIVSGGRGPG